MHPSQVASRLPVAQKVEQSVLQASTQLHLANASQSCLELPPHTIVSTRSPAATASEQLSQAATPVPPLPPLLVVPAMLGMPPLAEPPLPLPPLGLGTP